jgi:hypothetical protein
VFENYIGWTGKFNVDAILRGCLSMLHPRAFSFDVTLQGKSTLLDGVRKDTCLRKPVSVRTEAVSSVLSEHFACRIMEFSKYAPMYCSHCKLSCLDPSAVPAWGDTGSSP